MTAITPECGDRPRQTALFIWKTMSVGPAVFFLWMGALGLLLLLASYGFGPDPSTGPSDDALFGFALIGELLLGIVPLVAIASAEIIGVAIAYARREELAGSPFESHATSAIRTFWLMGAGMAGAFCLALTLLAVPNINAVGFGVGAMFILLATVPLLFFWQGFRIVRGWRRARICAPVADHPTRWS